MGTRLVIHPLFLLLLIGYGLSGLYWEAVILLGVLATHELAHLSAARAFEVDVLEIELMPFGGVARVYGGWQPEPFLDSVVALAGPFNNLLLVALGNWLGRMGLVEGEALNFFLDLNLGMAFFNLLPVLPLDGGRVYRWLLSKRTGYITASRILTRAGRLIAGAMFLAGLAGLFMDTTIPNLLLLSIFLYIAAGREREGTMFTFMQELLRKKRTLLDRRLLPSVGLTASEDASVLEVLKAFRAGKYHYITVVNRDLLVIGSITETELINGLPSHGLQVKLGELLKRHRT